jgi:hypothetical protein
MEQQQTTESSANASQAVTADGNTPVKKPRKKERYVKASEISRILRKTQGRACIAAQQLQMRESSLQTRIDKCPGLKEAQAEAVKFWEDLAEKTLVESVIRDKHIAGLMFFLRSRGKKYDLSLAEEPESELPEVLDLLANVKRPQRPNNNQNNEQKIEQTIEQTIEP